MPEVSLRRAAQISNSLKAKINEWSPVAPAGVEADEYGLPRRRRRGAQPAQPGKLSAQIVIDVDTVTSGKLDIARDEWFRRYERLMVLLDIQTRLLQALATANDRAGVQPLVTERVAVLRRQHFLAGTIATLQESTHDRDEFVDKLKALRGRLAVVPTTEVVTHYGASPASRDKLTVPLLTADDLAKLIARHAEIGRRLNEIDDQLVQLNVNNKLMIADADFGILREEGLA